MYNNNERLLVQDSLKVTFCLSKLWVLNLLNSTGDVFSIYFTFVQCSFSSHKDYLLQITRSYLALLIVHLSW